MAERRYYVEREGQSYGGQLMKGESAEEVANAYMLTRSVSEVQKGIGIKVSELDDGKVFMLAGPAPELVAKPLDFPDKAKSAKDVVAEEMEPDE